MVLGSDACGWGTSHPEIESPIVEVVNDLMFLKEYICVDCRMYMDLALLALGRLLPTIPGKFPILLFKVRPTFIRVDG